MDGEYQAGENYVNVSSGEKVSGLMRDLVICFEICVMFFASVHQKIFGGMQESHSFYL